MEPSLSDDIATALNREDFRQWLVELGAGEAGLPGEHGACPVARYLIWTTGRIVGVYTRRIEVDDGRVVTPDWTRQFIANVDKDTPFGPISAPACLEILDAIPA